MNTLLNILFGFLLFIFVSVSIVLISGWLIMQIMYDRVNQDDCGCSSCDCDDEPKINDFSKKTSPNMMFNSVSISIISICFCYFLQ